MQSDEISFMILMIVFVGILFWYIMQRQSAFTKVRLQRGESINRLIDKFATGKEVAEFLETEQGKKLLEDPLPSE